MRSLKDLLKLALPESVRQTLRRWGTSLTQAGWQRHCPVCGARTRTFRVHGNPPAPDAVCHVCSSKAPHRLAGLFFRQFQSQLFASGQQCVHVAPEPGLSRQLAQQCQQSRMTYRPGGFGDHYPEYFDITSLSLADQSVRLFYCCHVLNMLVDDRIALREVHRVLASDGVAVIQVPAFSTEPTTIECLGCDDDRMRTFGDPLMYRCYTDADYRSRLQDTGFHVESFHADSFPDSNRIRMGLHREVLHVAFRDPQHPVALALHKMRAGG